VISGILATITIILAVIITRILAVRYIRGKAEFLDDGQRRWLNLANNTATLILLSGLFFIWTPQIQSLALSLTAIAVAIVLSTKEIIMCITGGIYRATTNSFRIGDWITVGGITGEVMEVTALATKLEEVDTHSKSYEFTGKSITLPNSVFLTANVENANFTKFYTFHEFAITVPIAQSRPGVLIPELRKLVEKRLHREQAAAEKFIRDVERKTSINFPETAPKLSLRSTEAGNHQYVVQMLVKTQQALSSSSDIAEDFLDFVASCDV
jgi:small-conductance mechanosensitive channel